MIQARHSPDGYVDLLAGVEQWAASDVDIEKAKAQPPFTRSSASRRPFGWAPLPGWFT